MLDVVIGITTKDRQADLDETLNKLSDLGYNIPIFIIDDGSRNPIKIDHLPNFELIRLVRFNDSAGLVARRNYLARECQAKYMISLDDDSCFAELYNIDNCLQYMTSEANIFAVGLNVCESGITIYSENSNIQAITQYVGCGHIINVDHFNCLGGYRDFFQYGTEESDIGVRAFCNNKRIISWPSILVIHRKTTIGRVSARNWKYICRNTLLMWGLNSSWKIAPPLIARTIIGKFGQALVSENSGLKILIATIKGFASGIIDLIKYRNYRQPLDSKLFKYWLKMRWDHK
jgi:glycosyltransferase involved in cell wall biosynthesis